MLVCKTIIGRMSGNGGAIARNPISHTNALIRARYDCTLRALLDIQTQHGTPLVAIESCGVKRIMRTLNVRIMTTIFVTKKRLFIGQSDSVVFSSAPRLHKKLRD